METQKPATPVMDVHSPAPITAAEASEKPHPSRVADDLASAAPSASSKPAKPIAPRPKRDTATGVIVATVLVTLMLATVATCVYYQQRTQPAIVESPIVTK